MNTVHSCYKIIKLIIIGKASTGCLKMPARKLWIANSQDTLHSCAIFRIHW